MVPSDRLTKSSPLLQASTLGVSKDTTLEIIQKNIPSRFILNLFSF